MFSFNLKDNDYEVKRYNLMYKNRGEVSQKDEAIRNASLSAMLFMLAAKDKGWNTCPIIGFDPEAIKEISNNLVQIL